MIRVGTLEPRLGGTVEAIVLALREHQVGVGVVDVAVGIPALVDRERVREPLFVGQLVGEGPGQLDLVLDAELAREREIGTDEDPSVGTFVEIRGIPVEGRVVLSPVGHVAGLGVDRRIPTLVVVLVVPGDVVEGRGARGAASARARAKRHVEGATPAGRAA